MINPQTLALMKPSATLINASRGEVAQTEALLSAQQTLCLDVSEREPNVNRELLAKAFVATPHIAGYSAQGKANAAMAVVRAVARRFALPLVEWYPSVVEPVERKDITWEDMCQSIEYYCNLQTESEILKTHPTDFEALRNNYNYREEYF